MAAARQCAIGCQTPKQADVGTPALLGLERRVYHHHQREDSLKPWLSFELTSVSSFCAVGSALAFTAAEKSAEAYRPAVPCTVMGGCKAHVGR